MKNDIDASPPPDQNPTELIQIMDYLILEHVGEYRLPENTIYRMRIGGQRSVEIGDNTAWVVELVLNIKVDEFEMRIPNSNVLNTPSDRPPDDVDTDVPAGRVDHIGEWDGVTADSTTDLKN